jgi:hypothetical protein
VRLVDDKAPLHVSECAKHVLAQLYYEHSDTGETSSRRKRTKGLLMVVMKIIQCLEARKEEA